MIDQEPELILCPVQVPLANGENYWPCPLGPCDRGFEDGLELWVCNVENNPAKNDLTARSRLLVMPESFRKKVSSCLNMTKIFYSLTYFFFNYLFYILFLYYG